MTIEAIGRSASITADTSSTPSALSSHSSAAAPAAVHTDLPQPQAVIAAHKSEPLPADDAQHAQDRAVQVERQAPSFIKTKIVTDDAAHVIVFLSVDERTGEVIDKFPNTAQLANDVYQQASIRSKTNSQLVERVA